MDETHGQELVSWLVLIHACGGRASRLVPAIERAGSAQALVQSGRSALRNVGVPDRIQTAIQHPDHDRIEADLRWSSQPGHALVTWSDDDYPPLLRTIPDPPLALFLRGNPAVLGLPQLAMVGSRNPTPGGRRTAEDFARFLAANGLTITSGLASGIDGASHRGALAANGYTLAVLGTGPDIDYPAQHRELALEIIAADGAVVSEFPPGTPPRPDHFPSRNRIISGLSLGTLVVEAAQRSGSLITARLAGEQGREVFAIPGSIHNALARGCHQLIRQGAKLVETAADIIEELGPVTGVLTEASAAASRPPPTAELDPEYVVLLEALGFDPLSVDELVDRSGLTADKVSSMLLILELRGLVESAPGGKYSRVPEAEE